MMRDNLMKRKEFLQTATGAVAVSAITKTASAAAERRGPKCSKTGHLCMFPGRVDGVACYRIMPASVMTALTRRLAVNRRISRAILHGRLRPLNACICYLTAMCYTVSDITGAMGQRMPGKP
jgi:hypothetical protein